jgi:hypothetical protein
VIVVDSNILAGYMRRGTLTFDQAYALQLEAEDLLIVKHATMDKKVLRSFPERTFSLERISH